MKENKENLSVETPGGSEKYTFDDIAKVVFGNSNTSEIIYPFAKNDFDVRVYISQAGDAEVESSVAIKSRTLFSVDGKMISKQACKDEIQCIVSLQNKPAGVYLLRVETTQNTVVKKVVKPLSK